MNRKNLIDYGFKNPLYPKARGEMETNEKMAKLNEEAKNYESPTTKNISELESVPVNSDVKEKEVAQEGGDTFKYKYIEHGGEEYRVPNSVIKQLKGHLEEKPDLKRFKVKREGTGKFDTTYTVIPL